MFCRFGRYVYFYVFRAGVGSLLMRALQRATAPHLLQHNTSPKVVICAVFFPLFTDATYSE